VQTNTEKLEQVTLNARFSQRNLDYLTAFAILDDTTIGHQARTAIEQCTPEPDELHWSDDGRDRLRKVKLQMPPEMAARLGTLATDAITDIGQVMHLAFGRYIEGRLTSPELQEALERVTQQDSPPDCQEF
jgi:hypothetical protein